MKKIAEQVMEYPCMPISTENRIAFIDHCNVCEENKNPKSKWDKMLEEVDFQIEAELKRMRGEK